MRHQQRYVWNAEVEEFLETLAETATGRVTIVPRGGMLWRAQLGHDWGPEEVGGGPSCYGVDRMKPRPRQSPEGRAKPKGISYLYLATERDTAMAELRPHKGAMISIAQFVVLREIRIVDSSEDKRAPFLLKDEPSPEERATYVWGDIDRAFSRPVARADDRAEYAPTQVLAELFKSLGFDGIAYQSGLGEGHNLALFDLDAADQINGIVYQPTKVEYEFEQVSNRPPAEPLPFTPTSNPTAPYCVLRRGYPGPFLPLPATRRQDGVCVIRSTGIRYDGSHERAVSRSRGGTLSNLWGRPETPTSV